MATCWTSGQEIKWTFEAPSNEKDRPKQKRNKLRKSLDKLNGSVNRLREINTESNTVCSELTLLLLGE